MNKILASVLATCLLIGPMELAQEAHQGPFKLSVQAANAYTLDEGQILYAKKKSKSKGKKKSKKIKKSKKRKKSSNKD